MSDNYDRIIFPDKSYDNCSEEKVYRNDEVLLPDNASEIDEYIKIVGEGKSSLKYF